MGKIITIKYDEGNGREHLRWHGSMGLRIESCFRAQGGLLGKSIISANSCVKKGTRLFPKETVACGRVQRAACCRSHEPCLKHPAKWERGQEMRWRLGQGLPSILRAMGGQWRVFSREVTWSDFDLIWLCEE